MKNQTAGLLLIGFSILTAVISYGFDQLTNAVKESAAFVRGGGSIGTSEPSIPDFSLLLLIVTVLIGIYLLSKKQQ